MVSPAATSCHSRCVSPGYATCTALGPGEAEQLVGVAGDDLAALVAVGGHGGDEVSTAQSGGLLRGDRGDLVDDAQLVADPHRPEELGLGADVDQGVAGKR